jgi:hypothetical protein
VTAAKITALHAKQKLYEKIACGGIAAEHSLKGRQSTLDLLVQTSFDQLLLILHTFFTFLQNKPS